MTQIGSSRLGNLLGNVQALSIGLFGADGRHHAAQRTLDSLLGRAYDRIHTLAQKTLDCAFHSLLRTPGQFDTGLTLDTYRDHAVTHRLRQTDLDGGRRQGEPGYRLYERPSKTTASPDHSIASCGAVSQSALATRQDENLVGLTDHDVGFDEDQKQKEPQKTHAEHNPDELVLFHRFFLPISNSFLNVVIERKLSRVGS